MFKLKLSRDSLLNFLGYFLIFLFLLRLFSLFRGEDFIAIFWLCNHVPLVMGIAILLRKSFLLTGEISLLFFGFFNWVTDYVFKLLFDFHLFGATEYLFPIEDIIFFSITTSVHFLTIPLGLIALFLIGKSEPKAWKASFVHALLLVPFVFYFGREYNLNCFFEPCINWFPETFFYPLIFFLGYIFIVVIPITFILSKIVRTNR